MMLLFIKRMIYLLKPFPNIFPHGTRRRRRRSRDIGAGMKRFERV